MHKGFLGETKAVKIRMPVDMFDRIDKFANSNSSRNSIMITMMNVGIKKAEEMPKKNFLNLVVLDKVKMKGRIV